MRGTRTAKQRIYMSSNEGGSIGNAAKRLNARKARKAVRDSEHLETSMNVRVDPVSTSSTGPPNGDPKTRNKAKSYLRVEVTLKISADSKFFVQSEVCSHPQPSNSSISFLAPSVAFL
jgi:hypothetical protein